MGRIRVRREDEERACDERWGWMARVGGVGPRAGLSRGPAPSVPRSRMAHGQFNSKERIQLRSAVRGESRVERRGGLRGGIRWWRRGWEAHLGFRRRLVTHPDPAQQASAGRCLVALGSAHLTAWCPSSTSSCCAVSAVPAFSLFLPARCLWSQRHTKTAGLPGRDGIGTDPDGPRWTSSWVIV